MKAKSILILAISLLISHPVSVLFAGKPSFQGIGNLQGTSDGWMAMSADGLTAVGYRQLESDSYEAFRWTESSGMMGLGYLPGENYSAAFGVSANGSAVVGYSRSSLGGQAFRWTEAGDMVGLHDLPGGKFYSTAYDVSADGSVVVGFSSSGVNYEAFRWTESNGMSGLGFLFGEYASRAYAVSADGLVVVGYSGGQAFLWTEPEGMLGLGYLSGGDSSAYGISADGSVVVGRASILDGAVAFRWTDSDGMVSLGDLPGGSISGVAYDASNNGSIIVGMSHGVDDFEAFIWDEDNGMRNLQDLLINDYHLDLTGWHLRCAYGISDDGLTIVGSGNNPQGQREGWIAVFPKPPAIIYVDDDAAGANDGSSWADAYNYLQDALSTAWGGDEIRVAQGIYKPDQGAGVTPGDREATFQLINGVTIKGGFAGASEQHPNARDFELYETILSGDLDGNDVDIHYPEELMDEPTRSENSYHVVTGRYIDETAVLDGFTITAGNADSQGVSDRGGGMSNYSSSPTVTNCSFTANEGSGMFNKDNSKPTVVNCTFTVNSAAVGVGYGDGGGGMYNYESSPKLTTCSFNNNYAWLYGGGMLNRRSSPLLVKCTFTANITSEKGDGGGAYNNHSTPTMVECIFTDNYARDGGGMRNYFCSTILKNCIFRRNLARLNGGGLDIYRGSPTLTNCMFNGNSASWGGGLHNAGDDSYVTVNNCVFAGNYTVTRICETYGGAICNSDRSSVMLDNCTFMANTAVDFGGTIYNFESSATFTNCILRQNHAPKGAEIAIDRRTNLPIPSTVTVDYSNVQGGAKSVYIVTGSKLNWGIGNIDADPMFHDPVGADGIPGTEDDNLRLSTGSPCIDTGDPDYIPEPNETDLDGKPRVIGVRVDMGAYEYAPTIPAEARIIPRTLNLASKGKWISCHIRLPEDYNVADIDPDTIVLEGQIKAESVQVDQIQQVMTARFSRADVHAILDIGQIELTITGRLMDGTTFEGTDVIRVIGKGGRKSAK